MQRRDIRRSTRPSSYPTIGLDYRRGMRRRAPLVPAPNRRRGSLLIWLLSTVAVVLFAVSGVVVFLNRHYSGRIYPNIAINGIEVGRMTPDEARMALEQQLGPFMEQPLTLTYGDRVWQPTLEDLGVELDIQSLVDQAYQVGRGVDPLMNAEGVLASWSTGRNLPVKLSIDGPRLQRYLESLTAGIGQAPQEAYLLFGDTTSAISSSREGRLVLFNETLSDLMAAIQTLQPQQVAIRTELLVPRLRDEGLLEAKRAVDAILQSPVTLRAGEREWTLSQQELRALIRLERIAGADGDRVDVVIDETGLDELLAEIAAEIDRGRVNPRVRWNNGSLSITRPGRSGLRLNRESSAATIVEKLVSQERSIDLAVEELAPQVTAENLNSLGIKEAVGVGKSSFKGSAPYRITNIKVGSQILDGILIAPGEEFSFNNTVGAISARNGFVEGYAIIGNRTQLEFGGGICQDSTTLFRAAFYAGLPFTEWHHHSFRISWYEAFEPYGMDATIFTGQLDLRFVNDTGNWLLLQTYVDEQKQELTYVLYGTKPNRQVVRTNPVVTNETPAPAAPVYVADSSIPYGQFKQTDTARGGMTIAIYRVITENGAVVKREPFVTTFKPWPNIFLHNPRTPLPPPGCLPGRACR